MGRISKKINKIIVCFASYPKKKNGPNCWRRAGERADGLDCCFAASFFPPRFCCSLPRLASPAAASTQLAPATCRSTSGACEHLYIAIYSHCVRSASYSDCVGHLLRPNEETRRMAKLSIGRRCRRHPTTQTAICHPLSGPHFVWPSFFGPPVFCRFHSSRKDNITDGIYIYIYMIQKD